jgi:hypothetical protein
MLRNSHQGRRDHKTSFYSGPWNRNLYLTRVGMRRLGAGVCVAKDLFAAANGTNAARTSIDHRSALICLKVSDQTAEKISQYVICGFILVEFHFASLCFS